MMMFTLMCAPFLPATKLAVPTAASKSELKGYQFKQIVETKKLRTEFSRKLD